FGLVFIRSSHSMACASGLFSPGRLPASPTRKRVNPNLTHARQHWKAKYPRESRGIIVHDESPPSGPAAKRAILPVLLLLFVGSGCAALIYEVVWLQLLQLVIGSTALSVGVLLATFMGGMCLGSLLLPRLVSSRWHPLRVYALLELGIGAIA